MEVSPVLPDRLPVARPTPATTVQLAAQLTPASGAQLAGQPTPVAGIQLAAQLTPEPCLTSHTDN